MLTEHREDVVDLAELVDRLRAMLVQGLVAEKVVTADLAPVELAGQRATALALVFSELLSNALEHGGERVSLALRLDDGDVVLVVADDGRGHRRLRRRHRDVDRSRARPRRAARDSLSSRTVDGLHAEVRFPA